MKPFVWLLPFRLAKPRGWLLPLWLLAVAVAACNDRETLLEPSAPPTAMQRLPDASMQVAQAALDAQDVDAAEVLAREALKRDNENAEALVMTGDVALEKHRPAEALAAYERALTIDATDGWALVRASEALGVLGRSAEARTRLRAFVVKHPDAIPDVFDALGWLDLDVHDVGGANASFHKALEISKEGDADAWYGLAVIAADAENAQEVGRALRRVFTLEPGRRSEALKDEAFEPVRRSPEWRGLFESTK